MTGRPIIRAQMRTLDEVGEDTIFSMISSGKGTVPTIDELKVGRRAFYKWLDSADGRRDGTTRHEDYMPMCWPKRRYNS